LTDPQSIAIQHGQHCAARRWRVNPCARYAILRGRRMLTISGRTRWILRYSWIRQTFRVFAIPATHPRPFQKTEASENRHRRDPCAEFAMTATRAIQITRGIRGKPRLSPAKNPRDAGFFVPGRSGLMRSFKRMILLEFLKRAKNLTEKT